ncbi:hypothetical protein [Arenimonas sp. MALMAid1274]|uniref:hypothetical protein n=1 Tax=Arenimonas sp. MALMAid1274 TaxID=3411630 RepID=UPI003B9E4F2D
MDEMLLGGMIAILSALPGLALGVALLMGKWRPASMSTARDPARARAALGIYLILIDGLILLMGVLLIALPAERVVALVPYAVGTVVAVSTLGLVPLLRAGRS